MPKVLLMGIINLTPDSFFPSSRYNYSVLSSGADIADVGAISTRPGAEPVSLEEEWRRLEPFLKRWPERPDKRMRLSVDTVRSEIVARVYDTIGPFIVNDISSGEDDAKMLETVSELHLPYIAMHKRGNPRSMDSLADPSADIIEVLKEYFTAFSKKAAQEGIVDWMLDPGLGFAKTERQNVEILERLGELLPLGRPILIGAADKRFTRGDTEKYNRLAVRNGAAVLRVHDVAAARESVRLSCESAGML